jgi:hypothetical protein
MNIGGSCYALNTSCSWIRDFVFFFFFFFFFETESHVAQAGRADGIWWWGLCRRLALGEV